MKINLHKGAFHLIGQPDHKCAMRRLEQDKEYKMSSIQQLSILLLQASRTPSDD